jgi:hypothetical protein
MEIKTRFNGKLSTQIFTICRINIVYTMLPEMDLRRNIVHPVGSGCSYLGTAGFKSHFIFRELGMCNWCFNG